MDYRYQNLKLHYEVVGNGKPVILLHGLGYDLNMMKGCMEPVFQKVCGYKRIYVDLPGMGRSGAPAEFASADKILEVLVSFLQDTVKENFLLAGESYGGYLVRGILVKLPERTDGMLLLCPVAVPDSGRRVVPKPEEDLRDPVFLESLDEEARKDFCQFAVLADEQIYTRFREKIAPGLKLFDASFVNRLKQAYAFSFDVDGEIRKLHFRKPVLFLCGRQDACVGYQDQWRLLEDYPRASFSVIDAAGHNLQIEQPELFETLVKNWLLMVI
ncbi:MAG: alpha/beta hydrolase [Candidatus Limivivens sp.]|nr:alpha/beta hydrolase [Candidatus Limivivens sp.]